MPASVDAVAIPVFLPGPDADVQPADLAIFRGLLEAEFKARPVVRVVPVPDVPTPGAAIVEGTVTQYKFTEQQGVRLSLRTVDLALELRIRKSNDKSPPRVLRRRTSFQKTYPAGHAFPSRDPDFRFAAGEVIKQAVDALMPDFEDPLEPERAIDQGTGDDWTSSLLARGNAMAKSGLEANAELVWSLLLYDPATEATTGLYRVSDRALAVLGQRPVEKAIVDSLRPLQRFKPMDGHQFAGRVRDALGGATPFESLVLYLCRASSESLHLNLAATHRNLGRLYKRQKRMELASYHLGRSFAHYPRGEVWDEWVKLQTDRGIPVPDPALALDEALRMPAPNTAMASVTTYDLVMLPTPLFPLRMSAAAARGPVNVPALPASATPAPAPPEAARPEDSPPAAPVAVPPPPVAAPEGAPVPPAAPNPGNLAPPLVK